MDLSSRNVFHAIEIEFAMSSVRDAVLLHKGECGEGLPSDDMPLHEARLVLHDPGTEPVLRAAIWVTLTGYAQAKPARWECAAIWLMLPGLQAVTYRLHNVWGADMQDIRSDAIVGFLETLQKVDPNRQRLAATLWWGAFRRARAGCRDATRETASSEVERIAARLGGRDGAAVSPPQPTPPRTNVTDRTTTEGERLGSLAARLGLDGHLRAHRRPNVLAKADSASGNWDDAA